ncbi:thioredoxin family protein [Paludibaculum fermentans]|uniref:thioredoxin family protein n=1 Tax=Paludibaculum fermentans TaxID=1473598 RepID=UPI003EB85056
MASLAGATGWLNSPPLTAAGLRGKVVLIDFWTYTCINWMRTNPYIRAWSKKYREQGLVVVGVHTPEFEFEKDPANVTLAVNDLKVEYPVAMDSDRAIWRAFRNEYWPALYLADAQGRIRYHQFGEGGYDRSEAAIQQLLAEAGTGAIDREPAAIEAGGREAPADWSNLRSPETYLGYERAANFSSKEDVVFDKRRDYSAPRKLQLNQWALSGGWSIRRQAATLNKAGGRIAYRFHARDLHLVMGPAARGSEVRFQILLDGRPPDTAHGSDVDEQGRGVLNQQRMYQLIRQPQPIADRLFEIEFSGPGAEAFSFTFG